MCLMWGVCMCVFTSLGSKALESKCNILSRRLFIYDPSLYSDNCMWVCIKKPVTVITQSYKLLFLFQAIHDTKLSLEVTVYTNSLYFSLYSIQLNHDKIFDVLYITFNFGVFLLNYSRFLPREVKTIRHVIVWQGHQS